MAIAHLMLEQQNYVLGPGAEEAFGATSSAASSGPASRTAAASATRSTAPGCARQTGSSSSTGDADARAADDDHAQDILRSTVFAEDPEPETDPELPDPDLVQDT